MPAAEDRVISVKDSSDQNQHAGLFFVKPDIEVAAVSPPVNVAILAQIRWLKALWSASQLVLSLTIISDRQTARSST